MPQAHDHLPAREYHDCRQREFRQILQIMRIEHKEKDNEANYQVGEFGISPCQLVGGAFGEPVEVGHAAEEAGSHVGNPDSEETVIGVALALEGIDLLYCGIA